MLGELVREASARLVVMAGGGIRAENVQELVADSGVGEVHVRLTKLAHSDTPARGALRFRKALPDDEGAWEETDEERVRRFVMSIAARKPS
jgi:copper homeostasis protein